MLADTGESDVKKALRVNCVYVGILCAFCDVGASVLKMRLSDILC